MLTSRYMTSVKNLSNIMQKIVEGTAPPKFTVAHLKSIGFKSSNDLGVIPILKDLGFLTADGTPTQRYHEYRDVSRSKQVLGLGIREAYEDIFHINEKPTKGDRTAIEGKFKSTHNVSDRIAQAQASTFFALLDLADISGTSKPAKPSVPENPVIPEKSAAGQKTSPLIPFSGLRYNIEIHLPATKDVEVYNAIFKSLKEHLIDD